MTVSLPRDELTVPVVRRVLSDALQTLGVDRDCVSDIEIALTEACTNVLDHAVEGQAYEVTAHVDGRSCAIDVVDTGSGFDAEPLGHLDADSGAEAGRGIQLIRALVDNVRFTNAGPGTDGTVVHFEKQLTTAADAPLTRLAQASGSA